MTVAAEFTGSSHQGKQRGLLGKVRQVISIKESVCEERAVMGQCGSGEPFCLAQWLRRMGKLWAGFIARVQRQNDSTERLLALL